MDALIELIITEPGMAERLLGQHTDDGTGRCRVCTAGGQTGHYPYPCIFRLAADEANHRRRRPHDMTDPWPVKPPSPAAVGLPTTERTDRRHSGVGPAAPRRALPPNAAGTAPPPSREMDDDLRVRRGARWSAQSLESTKEREEG
jgi:hypothetical protein